VSAHDDTTEVAPRTPRRRPEDAPVRTGLVVVHAPTDPALLGAFLPVDHTVELGRGLAAGFVCQRPGQDVPAAPLTHPQISRRHLRLSALTGDRLSIENLGRIPLRLFGERVAQGIVGPGDLVEIEDQMLLLCATRACPLPVALEPANQTFAFGTPDASGLVGESPVMWALRGILAFVAPRPGHVLVLGPSGSGKELVAGALHRLSPRAGRPHLARNAATIPGTLMDAELFGHARNYPNAGMSERAGLVGEAEGGTLFLDEIGELPEALQAHLLRLMDAGEYQRLGEARPRRADVRIIAATNRPRESLKPDVLARFRHVVEVPPLRARREDLPLLVRHLLLKAARDDARLAGRFLAQTATGAEPRVSTALIEAVMRHPLTLQVRELDALLWRALSRSPGDVVELPPEERAALDAPLTDGPLTDPQSVTADALRAALEAHGGVQQQLGRALGLQSRYVLRRLLQKHGIE
jgi:two-component system nitrogen regulation response regulator GlnG/two-component system response regulator HydG